jgi:hypothetical protein
VSTSERRNDLVKYIREHVAPEQLIGLASAIALGEPINGRRPTIRQQLQAAMWIMEMGWGKPVQPIHINVKGKTGVPLPLAPMLASLWNN